MQPQDGRELESTADLYFGLSDSGADPDTSTKHKRETCTNYGNITGNTGYSV